MVARFMDGRKEADLAKDFNVDVASVYYHLKKVRYLKITPRDDELSWEIRQKQAGCLHTSFRCSGCSLFIDNTRRDDFRVIKDLRERVVYLEKTLRANKIPFLNFSDKIKED